MALLLPQVVNAVAVTESDVNVTTPDGTTDCYFVQPASGTAPGVLVWPDIFGLRPAVNPYLSRQEGPDCGSGRQDADCRRAAARWWYLKRHSFDDATARQSKRMFLCIPIGARDVGGVEVCPRDDFSMDASRIELVPCFTHWKSFLERKILQPCGIVEGAIKRHTANQGRGTICAITHAQRGK